MAMEQIGNFLKLILKNGGGSFVLTLILAWLFREYFDINPITTIQIIEFMLWLAFFQSIFVLIRGEFFTTLDKWKAYKKGTTTTTEMNGKNIAAVGKEVGLETFVTLIHKASEIKEKLSKTPEEKEKKQLEKDLLILENKIALIERDLD